jgi:hypothetical protein
MGEKRTAYRLLVRKPDGKRQLGKPRSMWEDNIRMHLVETRWDYVDWIGLAQKRDAFGFRKMLGNHRVISQLVGSCVVLSST